MPKLDNVSFLFVVYGGGWFHEVEEACLVEWRGYV